MINLFDSESVSEIVGVLQKHSPIIKAMSFVGQSTSKSATSAKGQTQKDQAEVIRLFKLGEFNTIVATSIGEEGLDIGEVDLIICFDAQASSTRMIQRMGRTGRKRKGRVVVLLSEGSEEAKYRRSQTKVKSITKTIAHKQYTAFQFYGDSPRMVPDEIQPEVEYSSVEIPEYRLPTSSKKKGSSKSEHLSEDQQKSYRRSYEINNRDAIRVDMTRFLAQQSIPSPIGDITHSNMSNILINTMQFIQDDGYKDSSSGNVEHIKEFFQVSHIFPLMSTIS